MTVFNRAEFSMLMEEYLDMGLTYAQAYTKVIEYERVVVEAIRSAELELAD